MGQQTAPACLRTCVLAYVLSLCPFLLTAQVGTTRDLTGMLPLTIVAPTDGGGFIAANYFQMVRYDGHGNQVWAKSLPYNLLGNLVQQGNFIYTMEAPSNHWFDISQYNLQTGQIIQRVRADWGSQVGAPFGPPRMEMTRTPGGGFAILLESCPFCESGFITANSSITAYGSATLGNLGIAWLDWDIASVNNEILVSGLASGMGLPVDPGGIARFNASSNLYLGTTLLYDTLARWMITHLEVTPTQILATGTYGSNDNFLVSLNHAMTTVNWGVKLPHGSVWTAEGDDGTIYAGLQGYFNGPVYAAAFSPTGQLLWQHRLNTGGWNSDMVVPGADSTAFFVTQNPPRMIHTDRTGVGFCDTLPGNFTPSPLYPIVTFTSAGTPGTTSYGIFPRNAPLSTPATIGDSLSCFRTCFPQAAWSSTTQLRTVTFAGPGAGTAAWSWDFGDGNSSSQQSPVHTYAQFGSYNVCLIVTDSCGADTSCQVVNITCTGPTAAFSDSLNGMTVYLTDSSTAGFGNLSWSWDFGDGNMSSQQNPVHSYAQFGNYTVCLVVTDTCGTDTLCQSVNIPCTAPVAAFSNSTNFLTAAFTDMSSSGFGTLSRTWDFGDGNSSSQQNPVHTYAQFGTYTVCLVVADSCGADSICQAVNLSCSGPLAAFSDSTNFLTAYFTDLSSSNFGNLSWSWDFGDGNSSSLQNPVHSYAAPGVYPVCLVVSDSCASDSTCFPVTVNCAPPTADFGFTVNMLDVNFSDSSSATLGMLNWNWDFGDGNSSAQPNPVHTYAQADTYQVCLVVMDSCGSDTACEEVIVTPPIGTDVARESKISIYPNPAAELVYFDVPEAFPANLSLTWYDGTGRKMGNGTPTAGHRFAIQRGNAAAGLYYYVLKSDQFLLRAGTFVFSDD